MPVLPSSVTFANIISMIATAVVWVEGEGVLI